MSRASVETEAGGLAQPATVRVWDPLVRIFHWSLAVLFFFAFLTGDEWDKPHEIAGYFVAGLVVFRILWGIVGSRHARFTDFIYRPAAVFAYLRDSAKLRARRYIGHNPAGGAMIVALLLTIAVICITGYMMTLDAWWGVAWMEEVHEVAANTTLVLVGLHVLGVIVASFEHRENLVRAMFTGRKRTE
jgi:cytochrome b